MRWKASPEPRIGDEKTDARFALVPNRTDDGYFVWLEWYTVRLRYETQGVATKGGWVQKIGWFDYKTELYHAPSENTMGYGGYD